MKIECNITDNYFNCFNEARGFALHKRKILKNRKAQSLSYIQTILIITLTIFLINLLINIGGYFNHNLMIGSLWLYLVTIIYLLFVIINIFYLYLIRKKQNFQTNLFIDEYGIGSDSFYDLKVVFDWDKIKAIIFGEYTITILTDTPCYLYLEIAKKDEIIKALKKYNKKDLIIK